VRGIKEPVQATAAQRCKIISFTPSVRRQYMASGPPTIQAMHLLRIDGNCCHLFDGGGDGTWWTWQVWRTTSPRPPHSATPRSRENWRCQRETGSTEENATAWTPRRGWQFYHCRRRCWATPAARAVILSSSTIDLASYHRLTISRSLSVYRSLRHHFSTVIIFLFETY